MTLKIIFKGDVNVRDIDKLILPDDVSHALEISNESANLNRHDISVGKSGSQTWIKIDGVAKSKISQSTIDSIKNTVPTDHIRTIEL